MIVHAILATLLYVSVSEAATAIGPSNTNFTGVVNREAILTCTITGFAASDNAQWSYKSTPTSVASTIVTQTGPTGTATFTGTMAQSFAVNGTNGGFNLIVKNVSRTDVGQYFCQVGGLSPVSPYLHIAEVGSLIMKQGSNQGPASFNVAVDTQVSVECTATNAKPLPVFRWYVGDRVLDTTGALTTGVTTPAATADASGFYTVTSTLSTKFAESQKGKTLTCAVDLSTAQNAVYTSVTLGVGANVASKLLLAALAVLAHSLLH